LFDYTKANHPVSVFTLQSNYQPASTPILKRMAPNPAPNFDHYANQVNTLLETHSESSDEVCAALDELRTLFPVPPTEIVSPTNWGTTTAAILRVNNHLKSDFADALRNIKSTGREPSAHDEQWLRTILTHWSGWSATDPAHMRDPWVQYLQALFGHLRSLVPILDSLVWPEELTHFPIGYSPIEPSFFLLATPQSYYIFDFEGLGLYCAGQSLEEVYLGLRDCRFVGDKEGDWSPEKWCSLNLDARDFFPVYESARNRDRSFDPLYPLQEFPANRMNHPKEDDDAVQRQASDENKVKNSQV
jgi:hypothetical protein